MCVCVCVCVCVYVCTCVCVCVCMRCPFKMQACHLRDLLVLSMAWYVFLECTCALEQQQYAAFIKAREMSFFR
jgi:hypothetical protein